MNKINNLEDARILHSIDKKINNIKKDLLNKEDIKNIELIRLIKDKNLNIQYPALFLLLFFIDIIFIILFNPTGFIFFILKGLIPTSLIFFAISAIHFSDSKKPYDYFFNKLKIFFNYRKYKIIKKNNIKNNNFKNIIMDISLLKKHNNYKNNNKLSREDLWQSLNLDSYKFYNEIIKEFNTEELDFLEKNNLSYFDIVDIENNILTYIKDNEKDITEEDFFKYKEMIKEIINNQAAFAQTTENETLSHFCLSLMQIMESKKSSKININEDISHLLNSKETIRF